MIKRIIKEPLLHFLVLGALIYLASMLWGNSNNNAQNILVSSGKIKHLATIYQKTWQRPPTSEQLSDVVQEYVLEQVAYYEGVNLGLDKNDVVITRRIRQKLDFIAEESTTRPTVSDDILSAYLQDNPEKFRTEPMLTIRQVYLDPNKHPDALNLHIENLLSQLTTKPDQDITTLGERYMFKPTYQQQSISELARLFGTDFAQTTLKLTPKRWYGPVHSSFGVHLIYVEEKQSSLLPKLADIRPQVLREWENSLRIRSTKDYYDQLLGHYPVMIDWSGYHKSLNKA